MGKDVNYFGVEGVLLGDKILLDAIVHNEGGQFLFNMESVGK
jgi:hypothetical protein